MSTTPENIEFLSFRRTFTLLIVLVVLPSAGLSGFGVVAIINERAAVEKRLELVWGQRLASVRDQLKRTLASLSGVPSDAGLVLTLQGRRVSGTGFVVEGGTTRSDDARLRAAVTGLGPELAAVPEHPVVFSLGSTQGTFLLAAMRDGGRIVGCELAVDALDELFPAMAGLSPQDPARLELVAVQREAPQGLLARFVAGVSGVRDSALGPRELAGLALPSPLQDFRLVASVLGEDPVAQASTRNRILYGVLLGVFYIALFLGVLYTGRTLYREAHVSRLKTDFVSLVSHELRTPLTSIRMFIDMLDTGRVRDVEEQKRVFGMLAKETARLSVMIDGVLDWARIEGGRKQYHLEPVPVQRLVDAAAESFRLQRAESAMDFRVEVAPDLPPVRADADAFPGALLNLLQNAFKYTGQDKHIVLKALRDDGEVVFEVEDNGVGIARREQRRIFERFYRVDSLLTRSTEGSGLGLSIAQRIVAAHGGRISVDSTVGKGSTFRIHLPT
jgi:two-component system, OmpR family, phosphate regulon sensor histidine kinase PhoR